jgi:hypothetical protein
VCEQLNEKCSIVNAHFNAMLIHRFGTKPRQMRRTHVTHSAAYEMHKAASHDRAAALRTIEPGHPERDWMIRIRMIKRCENVKNQRQESIISVVESLMTFQ